ncbi:XRE family transcriptional regulator [Salegentibacter sp. F188]|uniref:XRE family transcriptional regulator n=1 Tax=Autumnicola patrickiae TaxID=3075591 RepID=A0ABU3E6C8_9FLAO|nr:XRE family transcriptional regulator [Salegentibacter sp. F188]MDT0691551.1 XRE family transcriptional regulator [Salegentibacter sp. F188]
MKGRQEIGKRIKELRREHKFSQKFVAERLFISQAAYSLIESSQNGIVAEHIVNLSKLYDVTTDYLLKGDKFVIKMSISNGFVPYIGVSAHAGFIENYNSEAPLDNYDWYRIPGFNPTQNQKLFEVEGNSMAPTILSGDVVICQTQRKLENVLDGSLVLIITKESILVKRIRLNEDPGSLILENDNVEDDNEREQIEIKKQDIRELMMVRGKISGVLVPHHEIASKGKIKALEDALEMLKKEVYKLNKKIAAISH